MGQNFAKNYIFALFNKKNVPMLLLGVFGLVSSASSGLDFLIPSCLESTWLVAYDLTLKHELHTIAVELNLLVNIWFVSLTQLEATLFVIFELSFRSAKGVETASLKSFSESIPL